MRSLLLLAALAALAACDDKPKPDAAAPTASATAAAPSASATEPLPTPEALDVDALKKALKCGAAGHGPCSVLAELADCKQWDPVTQSGDGRWVGEGYVVDTGAFTEELTLLRTRRVPLDEVGPGQLPAKISIDKIPDDLSGERENAQKAIGAYKRGDVPTKFNTGVEYIKKREDWPEAFSMKAKGNQVFVAVDGGAHLCALPDQRLLMVRRAASPKHPADGVYAMLWPVSW
jgi:hypothetical protein